MVGIDLQDQQVQPSTQHYHHVHHQTKSPSATSAPFDHLRDGDSSTSLFQFFTTLSMEKSFPTPNPNLPRCNLRLFTVILNKSQRLKPRILRFCFLPSLLRFLCPPHPPFSIHHIFPSANKSSFVLFFLTN